MIQPVSELQINIFRLLHGKIVGSLLAFSQKLCIETLFPEAVSYSLLPSECRCILCFHHKDLGCPELMGYNPCGQGRKCVGLLSPSVATSLRSWYLASLSKRLRKEREIVLSHRSCTRPKNPKTASFWISSCWCIPPVLMFRCFFIMIFSVQPILSVHAGTIPEEIGVEFSCWGGIPVLSLGLWIVEWSLCFECL